MRLMQNHRNYSHHCVALGLQPPVAYLGFCFLFFVFGGGKDMNLSIEHKHERNSARVARGVFNIF